MLIKKEQKLGISYVNTGTLHVRTIAVCWTMHI